MAAYNNEVVFRVNGEPVYAVIDPAYGLVFSTEQAARGFGVTTGCLHNYKSRRRGSFAEGKHWFYAEALNADGHKIVTPVWTKAGILEMGKSKRSIRAIAFCSAVATHLDERRGPKPELAAFGAPEEVLAGARERARDLKIEWSEYVSRCLLVEKRMRLLSAETPKPKPALYSRPRLTDVLSAMAVAGISRHRLAELAGLSYNDTKATLNGRAHSPIKVAKLRAAIEFASADPLQNQ